MTNLSNRKKAFEVPMSNPATKFFSWKSNDKVFSFYNKETKENENVKLPFKFLVLDELHTVKGWSDANNGNIISNEVKFISKETINVKCYHKNIKGENVKTDIVSGLYKEIKPEVVAAGGKYHKSVYIMLEGGEIANIQLKGAGVQAWGDFTNKNKARLPEEWIIVKSVTEGKKGSVKYTTPTFTFERTLSDVESEQADFAFNTLESYLKTYLAKAEPIDVNNIEVNDEEDLSLEDDDLEF
jgi:hypothetical protein